MNKHVIISKLLPGKVRFASVTFDTGGGKQGTPQCYTYKTHLDLSEGDLVVVQTNKDFYKVVKVVDPEVEVPADAEFEFKWIVDRISLDGFKAARKEEKDLWSGFREVYQALKAPDPEGLD